MITQGLQVLCEQEGWRDTVYYDTETPPNPTIWYGRNLMVYPFTEAEGRAWTQVRCTALEEELSLYSWYQGLDPVRQSVIGNMAYNMGVKGVCGFSGMIANLGIKYFAGAAEEMLASTWADQVPTRAKYLAEVMRNGAY